MADTGRSSAGTDATAVPQQEGEGLEAGGAGDKDVTPLTTGGQRGPGAAGVSQESRDRRRRLLPPKNSSEIKGCGQGALAARRKKSEKRPTREKEVLHGTKFLL